MTEIQEYITCGRRAVLLVAGMVMVSGPTWARSSAPRASTQSGVVIGTEQGDTAAFLGVPYAAPPLGDLRFRPPVLPVPWPTPRDATAVSAPCTQPNTDPTISPSEDCLYLNVWTKLDTTSRTIAGRRPVMVFIHGGGFQKGGGSYPYLNGAIMAEKGNVVVVNFNYRLGALGFLTSQAFDAESPYHISGNYGIEDQQAVIRWVHRNIAAFGGDPNNVTIFGESGGGISVEHHMVSPLVAGLFSHAIIESAIGNAPNLTLAEAETGTSAGIIAAVGCSGASDVAACLRAVPANGFLLSTNALAAGSAKEVIDGVVIPLQTLDAFNSGQYNHVPVIIGTTHDEYTFNVWPLEKPPNPPILSQSAYAAQLNAVYGSYGPAVLAQYPASSYPSAIQALAAAETDSNGPCYNLSVYASLARAVPTYAYEFNEPNPATGSLQGPPVAGLNYGDVHTSDLPYVFGVSAPAGTPVTGKDVLLSSTMIGYWTNMAKSGNPNFPHSVATSSYWPEYDTRRLLSLKDSSSSISTAALSRDHHCSFWNGVPPP